MNLPALCRKNEQTTYRIYINNYTPAIRREVERAYSVTLVHPSVLVRTCHPSISFCAQDGVSNLCFLGKKKKRIRFSDTAASVQKVPHIWFFSAISFFWPTKIRDTGFYCLTWESFLTKLQSRPQTYDIFTNLQRKLVNYALFVLFETLNLQIQMLIDFRYFR